MSRTAVLGSNALATAVQFYAAALDEATRRADQAEALLKQAMQHPRDGDVERLMDELDNRFIDEVVIAAESALDNPVAKVARIRKAIDKRREQRRAPPGSPTIDRNLVTADDAPRGGEVREADVPR